MSSVLNKIANAVTGHNTSNANATNPSNSTSSSNPSDPSNPSGTGGSYNNNPSGLPAGNQNSGVGTNYAGTNYSATNNGALKEGSQVRDTGLNSGRTGDYSTAGSGSSLGSTAAGTGAGAGLGAGAGYAGSHHHHHHHGHHGTSSSLGSSTSSSLGSSTASSLGSSTASSLDSSTASGLYSTSADERSGFTDDAMTRSEEHLLVGKEKVNVGTAALNKYVTTEKVSTAIPIVREKAVVEREPITESNRDAAMRGPDFKESHYEVNLMEERAVAEKQTVPIERVRLRKEAEQTQQYVEADLRKEHIELVDPTKEAGLGRNNVGAGIGKNSADYSGTGVGTGTGTGTGTGVGSSYSATDRQIAADDPNASASRQY